MFISIKIDLFSSQVLFPNTGHVIIPLRTVPFKFHLIHVHITICKNCNKRHIVLTVAASHSDLRICPLTFLVFVDRPLYNETPDTPSKAATALISIIKRNQRRVTNIKTGGLPTARLTGLNTCLGYP